MSENDTDDSQKTEDPTPKKLEEARKRGQVIYSREVTNWIMLFTITMLVLIAGPGIMEDLSATLKTFLADPHIYPTDGKGLMAVSKDLFWAVMGDLLLPFGIMMVMGILSGYIQTGPIFTAETMKPDIKKIS
ncbi:MAG: flhB, partial [Alphaproteobacteria bacterium]|nr:flhB [Alphaproteobacteria bacterium]